MGAQISPSQLINAILNVQKYKRNSRYMKSEEAREATRHKWAGETHKENIETSDQAQRLADSEEKRKQQTHEADPTVAPFTAKEIDGLLKKVEGIPGGEEALKSQHSLVRRLNEAATSGEPRMAVFTRINAEFQLPHIRHASSTNFKTAKANAINTALAMKADGETIAAITQTYDKFIEAAQEGTLIQEMMPMLAEIDRREKAELEAKATAFGSTKPGMDYKATKQKEVATHKGEIEKEVATHKAGLPLKPGGKGVEERRDVATAKDLAKAEEVIQGNPDKPEISGHIDMFNRFSKKPYMYMQVTEEGRIYDSIKLKKVKLPKINGKQATAKDVSDTAEKRGITIEEVLGQIGVKIE